MVQEEERKKILFIITKSVWGGAQKYVYDLAVNLPKDKFSVLVAAGGNGLLAGRVKEAEIEYCEIKNFKRDISFISDILAFFEILKLLKNFKPNIVHINSSKAGGIAGAAILIYKFLNYRNTSDCHSRESGNPKDKKSFKVIDSRFPSFAQSFGRTQRGNDKLKAIFTAHGWAFNEARPKWQIFLIKLASRATCRFYDKIICVSEFDRQAAIKNKIAAEGKLITIHNGIDIDEGVFFDKEKAREKIFNFQIPIFNEFSNSNFQNSNNIIIGTVGEFTKNKGQEYLIEVAKKFSTFDPRDITRRGDNFQFSIFIIGWGEDKQKLEAKVKELGLEDKIFLIEALSPAAPCLKAFDVFVLPSLKEGLPYILLEAGLAGIPVIATEVGGIPEIVAHEKTGLLVSPADSNSLVSAIKKLLEDKNLAENLAKNLRQKIIQEFSLEKMVRETLKVYS